MLLAAGAGAQQTNPDAATLLSSGVTRWSGDTQTNAGGATALTAGYASEGLVLTPLDGGRAHIEPLLIDTTAPVVTVDALETNDTTPALSGTVDDTAAAISVSVDGQTVAATNNGDGTWTLADDTLAPLAEGVYDVAVSADDGLGNIGTDTTADELIIDTTAPVVTVATLITNNNTPSLSGTVDDPLADVSLTVATQNTSVINNGDGTWTLADGVLGAIADGTYDVAVSAFDAAGNAGTDTTLDELVVDTTAPAITLNGGATIALVAGVDTYAEPGASVFDAGDPSVTIVIGGDIVDDTTPGIYEVTYDATDAAGNAALQVVRTVNVVPPVEEGEGEGTPEGEGEGTPEGDGEGTPEGEGEGTPEGEGEGTPEGEGEGTPEGEGEGTPEGEGEDEVEAQHAADSNGDGLIDLSELLRVTQFYNGGEFHCESGSEDGFAPGPGARDCRPHTADYNPQDWAIDLSELLRVIQFFRVGGVQRCPGLSEDNFCPVAPELQFLLGDVDANGKLTTYDLQYLYEYLAGERASLNRLDLADVNQDSVIDRDDFYALVELLGVEGIPDDLLQKMRQLEALPHQDSEGE